VENLQEGDEIEGILQKQISMDKHGWDYTNYYLENPHKYKE